MIGDRRNKVPLLEALSANQSRKKGKGSKGDDEYSEEDDSRERGRSKRKEKKNKKKDVKSKSPDERKKSSSGCSCSSEPLSGSLCDGAGSGRNVLASKLTKVAPRPLTAECAENHVRNTEARLNSLARPLAASHL